MEEDSWWRPMCCSDTLHTECRVDKLIMTKFEDKRIICKELLSELSVYKQKCLALYYVPTRREHILCTADSFYYNLIGYPEH